MSNKNFSEYLLQLRKENSLSTRKLAEASGVSQSYISHVENGRKANPSPDILKKLSKPLGVTYEELMIAAGHWRSNYSDEDKARFEEIHNEEANSIQKISSLLKLISDDEGVFPDYIHNDLYKIIGGMNEQTDGQYDFSNWYFDFLKREEDEITKSDIEESHEEFNKFFNYTTVKNGIINSYDGFKLDIYTVQNELIELIYKHGLTESVGDREKTLGHPLEIELNDILNPSSLTVVKYNDRTLKQGERLQILGMLKALFHEYNVE